MRKIKWTALILMCTLFVFYNPKIILPPHSEWSNEDISQVLYFNGKSVPFPFCLDDLGEDYTFGDDMMYLDNSEYNIYVTMNYKGKPFAGILFFDMYDYNVDRSSYVNCFAVDDTVADADVSINGVRRGDTEDKMSELFGTASNQSTYRHIVYVYENDNAQTRYYSGTKNVITSVVFDFDGEDRVNSIWIGTNLRKNPGTNNFPFGTYSFPG